MATPDDQARREAAEELIRAQYQAKELARVNRIRQEDAARVKAAQEAYDKTQTK